MNEDNNQIYRFARVPFGIICSPFLLSGSIQHCLNNIGTELALKLPKEMYCGEATPQQAINLSQIKKEIFKNISMNLWEWASNSTDMMTTIPKEERASGNSIKVLELEWNFQKDILHIRNKSDNQMKQPNAKFSKLQ